MCVVQWKRQYAEFSKTTAGQIVFFAAFFFVCYSGLIWRILNLLFILWWIAPLFVLPAINYLNKKVKHLSEPNLATLSRPDYVRVAFAFIPPSALPVKLQP